MRKLVLLFTTVFSLSTAMAQITENDVNLAKQLVAKNFVSIGIAPADINNSIVSSTYETREKIRMVYLQQSHKGIPVFNQMHVLAFNNEKAVSVSGRRITKIENAANSLTGIPAISAEQAVLVALNECKLSVTEPMQQPTEKITANGSRKFNFGTLKLAYENITAELIWFPVDENKVKLAWLVFVAPGNADDFWLMMIDAFDQSILGKQNLTAYDSWDQKDIRSVEQPAEQSFNYVGKRIVQHTDITYKAPIVNGATYNVIKYPAESPNHPGGTPALHTDPWTWAPGNATSLKWHDDGPTDYTITRGNNVWATEGQTGGTNLTGTIQTPAGQPATSSTTPDPLTFNSAPNFAQTPTSSVNQQFGITNLFYWNNLLHDITYVYGFDEASANFQNDNQGRGGTGGDYVIAVAQSAAGTNNANFSTPGDGSRARMRMYIFTAANPDRDGDLDNGIVAHEFGHGISNRLTGGGSASCLGNVEQGGEGWGDYMALMLTTDWATASLTDGFNVPRAMGTYAVNQATTGSGIRLFRYCTNIAVNPLTYASMGVAPVGTEVHNIGEIWCMALWEMTWQIIQTAGINPNLFNPAAGGGNAIAFKLVVEGMRLQPCNPGYIDARNAILKADTLFFGGQYSCAIWTAFAKRGMGRGASQGSSNSATDQTASFIVSSAVTVLNENVPSQIEGANVTYTNKVTADGCGAISNYYVTDTLPTNVTYVSGGSYNAGNRTVTFTPINLASGATQTFPYTVSINAGTYFAPVTHFTETVPGATIPAAWTASSINATVWSVATSTGHSLPNSFAALYNVAAANDLSLATTNQINLTPNSVSNYTTLSFWHQYNTEEGWDGGVVEISTNNGATWSDLGSRMVKNGYNGTLGTGSNLAGRSAFTGAANTFKETIVNLSSYVGQNIRIRFRFGSDNNTGAPTGTSGWWVDDIVLYSEPAVQIRSNLFNGSNVRQSFSDTLTRITVGCTTATITTQPSNANGCVGGSTTFSVVVSGGGSPTYQWQENTGSGFVNLANNATYSNVTTATLTISNITAGMNGYSYRVVVGNSCTSSFNSNSATLNVGAVAAINSHPSNASVCPGVNVNFSVGVTNATSYQWQVNSGSGFVDIPNAPPYSNATTATLTITNVTTGLNNNQYRCVIGSCPSSINSNSATLQVSTPLSITSQPASVAVCQGQGTTFSVTVAGSVTGYQWQLSTDNGATYNNIGSATTSSYTLTSVALSQNGNRFKVIITGACGNVTSAEAILTVNPLPVFTLGTIPTSACNSDLPITLTASVAGGVWTGNGVSGTTFSPVTAGAGNHTVTYTVTALGCSAAQSANIQVSDCSDRHLVLSDVRSVLVYPNPNDGNFSLEVMTDLYKKLGVKVFDSHGRLVRAYFFNSIGYGSVIPMKLTALEDGVYHLYLYNEENGFIKRGVSIVIQN
ncbi:MAG: hypothetical protein HOP10_12645 [Chitinophagaceae bacterium]|nr:hypothetical protein [Chitinophagaceae bacterium]